MNRNQLAGNWDQLKGKARELWGKITDDELERIAGRRDQLVGAIKRHYGMAQEEAERQVRNFEQRSDH